MSTSSPPSSMGSGNHGAEIGGEKFTTSTVNLEQLKALQDKKVTKDGKAPKKRGPKPDMKPALTRRQELNRQAQRTHRERKETYIKALEDEVLRLKQVYTGSNQDKRRLFEENQALRALLQQHGIEPPARGHSHDASSSGGGGNGNDSSMGYAASTTPQAPGSTTAYQSSGSSTNIDTSTHTRQHMDYEQAGIEFVLTLERPCMDHVRDVRIVADRTGLPLGHAALVSCPLDLRSNVGLPQNYEPGPKLDDGTVNTGQLSKADLATLLHLSSKLDLGGEITPVMAWGALMGHSKVGQMSQRDFVRVTEELQGKVRCYGFGAVFEDFEFRDALEAVLGSKQSTSMLVC